MTPTRRQGGFTLVAVIFLIVVLGGAITLLATLSTQSTAQLNQNLLQSRARLAALAGLEWATQRLVTDVDPETFCTDSMQNVAVPVPAYPSINVTLLCTARSYDGGETALLNVRARAQTGQLGAVDYVWTEQNATLEFDL
ncbi:type II secretion system protein [Saccharospirillum mangrovi]|uniref:type II secretion system protein n=1 Tax=Saccharospirillum mangrovi TaxID=2161747 RepID=UPI000D37B370|nr:type II secretion system protein [Saccharospirillum mangrovi]